MNTLAKVLSFVTLLAAALGAAAQPVKTPVDVNVINTPTVTVGNAVNVNDITKIQPVSTTCRGTVSSFTASCDLYTVPAGKRLIVETVNWQIVTLTSATVVRTIFGQGSQGVPNVIFGANTVNVPTPRTFSGTFDSGTAFFAYDGTQQVKLYLDEGAILRFSTYMSSTANGGFGPDASFSGVLVNK
jgi:hypothetical protein